jgi:hypothetical protein
VSYLGAILFCVFAIRGVIALIHDVADAYTRAARDAELNVATSHKLPRAVVRQLRDNRLELTKRLMNRSSK